MDPKKIHVEGFDALVSRGPSGAFVIVVPELPGVIGQVDDISEAKAEIRRLIGIHLRELAAKKGPPGRE